MGGKMRVMTFNLRFENDKDGANDWESRRRMVVNLINDHAPDILGTQEGKWSQLSYLQEMLPDYDAFMPDRVYDSKIQCPTLFVQKKRFEILEGRDIWLSETPEVHLSKSWDSAFPRMMSYCLMIDRTSGNKFHAGVTHLDHVGVEARRNQAKIIACWAKSLKKEPKIVMGDFNEEPGSDVHRILTAPETRLLDTWEVLEKPEDETAFTHHGFTGTPQLARLDWILASGFDVLDAGIVRDQKGGNYPSDHFPYMVDLAPSNKQNFQAI